MFTEVEQSISIQQQFRYRRRDITDELVAFDAFKLIGEDRVIEFLSTFRYVHRAVIENDLAGKTKPFSSVYFITGTTIVCIQTSWMSFSQSACSLYGRTAWRHDYDTRTSISRTDMPGKCNYYRTRCLPRKLSDQWNGTGSIFQAAQFTSVGESREQ